MKLLLHYTATRINVQDAFNPCAIILPPFILIYKSYNYFVYPPIGVLHFGQTYVLYE